MTSSLTTSLSGETESCWSYSKKDAMQPSGSEMESIGFVSGNRQEISDLHRSEMGEASFQRLCEIVSSVHENPHTSSRHNLAVESLPSEGCLPPCRPPPEGSSKCLGSSWFRQNNSPLIRSDKWLSLHILGIHPQIFWEESQWKKTIWGTWLFPNRHWQGHSAIIFSSFPLCVDTDIEKTDKRPFSNVQKVPTTKRN